MDHKYFIVKISPYASEVKEFEGNEWGKAYEHLVKLRNAKGNNKVLVIRGMEIERFKQKNEK